METLTNGILTIGVKEHGAELASLCCNGRQYLWQADPAFWKRHSPVLFPFVGSVWNGEFHAKGETYKMSQHGFARDMDFIMHSKTDDEIWYRLLSSDETRTRYPYDFCLEIGYKLIGKTVRVMWHVVNTGAETLPFQIGAHPAFYWPLLTDAEIEGGIDAMTAPLADTDRRGYFKLHTTETTLPRSVVTEGGCIGAETTVTLDDEHYLELSVQTFGRDALVFENSLIKGVTLCDNDKHPYLTMTFDSPLVGLWSPPGKRAPFVCIEPWYGRADEVRFTGDLSQKKWIQLLPPHTSFDAHYDITVE